MGNRTTRGLVWVSLAGALLTSPWAVAQETKAETKVLATSKTRKLQVLAEGGTDWCQPSVQLRMVLEPDSPDIGNPAAQIDVMNRMKTPITTDCKTAVAAKLIVIEKGKETGTYTASAAQDWAFSAAPVQTAAAPVAKPALAPVAVEPPAPAKAAPPVAAKEPPTNATGNFFDMMNNAVKEAQPQVQGKLATPATTPPPAQPPVAAAEPAPVEKTLPAPAPKLVEAVPPAPEPKPVVLAEEKKLAPPPEPVKSIPVIAPQLDYHTALLRAVQDSPELANEPSIMRCWSEYRFPGEARKATGEFQARPLEQKVQANLKASIAAASIPYLSVFIEARLGTYDFETKSFPLSLGSDRLDFIGCGEYFYMDAPDRAMITSLPMEEQAAKTFVETRSQYGALDRSIYVLATFKIDQGFKRNEHYRYVAKGSLAEATIYSDAKRTRLVTNIHGPDLQALKVAYARAEALRKLQQEREKITSKRQLAQLTTGTRSSPSLLGGFISEGSIDDAPNLSSLLDARARALVSGKPITVPMLVQAKSSGRDKVSTRWPGKLRVTIPETQDAMKSDGWYLVYGQFSVPDEDGLPDADLAATASYACEQPHCAEIDADKLLERKFPLPTEPAQ